MRTPGRGLEPLATPPAAAADHGADGPAALAREVEDVVVATGSAAIGRERIAVRRVRCECKVDWLWRHGHLTQQQHAAGMRFRRLWLAATSQPRLSGRYGEAVGRSSVQAAVGQRSDATADVDALLGPDCLGLTLSATVIAVCGQDEDARGRVSQLREGLDRLIEWWRIGRDW